MQKAEDKYAWTVKVGEKGQIVIPKEACEILREFMSEVDDK